MVYGVWYMVFGIWYIVYGIWIMVYLFGWGYIGWKMFDKIEEVIVKFINKFKKK